MGLGEILGLGANVVLKLKADTSEAKAALKGLSDEERKAAEAALKLSEAENKRLETKAKRYQFAAQAIGGVSAAIGVAKSGLEAYAKTSSQAADEVKKIQDASSKAFDGVMASIGKVVVQLEPLITRLAGVVSSLNDIGVTGPLAIGALGLAVTGNPAVAGAITLLGFAMDGKTDVANAINDPRGYMARKAAERNKALADAANTINSLDPNSGRLRNKVDDAYGALSSIQSGLANAVEIGLRRVGIDKWNPFDPKKGGGAQNILDPDNLGVYGSRYRLGAGSGSTGRAASIDNSALDRWQAQQTAAFRAGSAGLMNPYAQIGDGIRSAQQSQLAQVFGPLSDFSAYQAAFDGLTGAVGSALGAWIDGSMSAGKAFKAFIGEAVKGIAIQMAMEALKHGAYAIGSLAYGDLRGAALHGKAAAGFAAGAIVASAAAKGLAPGASTPTPAGYTPSGGASFGAGQGSSGTNVTIVYGDAFAEDSPRQRALTATRLVNRALGSRSVVEAR